VAGELNLTRCLTGTSNAAALTTRTATLVADAVEGVYLNQGINWLQLPTRAAILKALLVHGCVWGPVGDVLDEAYPPSGSKKHVKRRSSITRFLGYGRPNLDAVVEGAPNRVTLLAQDQIATEELHEYRLPIPAEMLRSREIRRLTLTLAWSSPVVASRMSYRAARLQLVNRAGKFQFWDRVGGKLQPPHHLRSKGTVIHHVFEGDVLIKALPTDGIFIGVQSVPVPGIPVVQAPYALAVSLEVGTALNVNLYNAVRTAIRSPVRARVRTRT
jgi:hypothetical protein